MPFPDAFRGFTCAVAALLAGAAPALSYGQAYDRIAPKTLPENAPAAAPAPAAPAPMPASDKVVLQALKGLVFLSDPAALKKGGVPGPVGISAPGLPLLAGPGFTAQVAPFIGQKVTLADLNTIAQRVTGWYREHDQPFMSVTVPPQNISSGIVQIVVSQYRVGAVKTQGNEWFSDDLLIGESGIVSGQPLSLGDLQDDLDRLNGNPFRNVTTVFQPGAEAGQTDVVLKTEDRLPLRLYASFDNAGQASLGRGEWSVGANWGNAFGLDQQVAYQFTRSISSRFDAHSLSWTAPLPWRDKVIVFGSYEEERPDVGRDFGETGTSGQGQPALCPRPAAPRHRGRGRADRGHRGRLRLQDYEQQP